MPPMSTRPTASSPPRVVHPDEIGVDPVSCRELFCAVIGLAIRDCERIKFLKDKAHLTPYEAKKLAELTESCHPADFFEGDWFESLCSMLAVHSETIRGELQARRMLRG